MPLANYRSTEAALSELEAALDEDRQIIDLCLSFRAKSTGREILRVGGRWNRRANNGAGEYLDADPSDLAAVPIWVNDNQIAVVEAFRRWLEARIEDRERVRLLLTGGNRRGGKSWIVTALAVAVCIAIPDAIVFLVSPTLEKREELDRYILQHSPREWRRYLARELRYVFPTGGAIRNVTGDDPEAIKRGEADLVIFNEPQMMASDVLTNGAPAIIDKGGLVLFAGNPSRRRKGLWFTRLWNAVEKGDYAKAEVYRLDRRENPNVDQGAGEDIGALLRAVDPQAAKADDEGAFVEPGDYVYADAFDERRNCIDTFPTIAPIITSRIIARKIGSNKYSNLCGVDFQQWPGNAGVEVVAVGSLEHPTWYIRRWLMVKGEEDVFLDDAFGVWPQDSTLWIGDASGAWQDAAHIRGRNSFDVFKARRWRIEPPAQKRSDRGVHPANPSRENRINLVCQLLREGRLIICMDEAADIAADFQKCEADNKGRPKGHHAHRTDAIGYPLWWATPAPTDSFRAKTHTIARSLPSSRPGADFKF